MRWIAQMYAVTYLALSAGLVAGELPTTEFAARFDQVWSTLQEKFYDPGMHGVDWRRVGDQYRDRAIAAGQRTQFQRVVNEMLGELKASHLFYYTADDFDYYFMQQVFRPDEPAQEVDHVGVMGRLEPDGYVVVATLEGGPAALAELRPGDRLVSVDGIPFTSAGAFRGLAGKVTYVAFQRDGGREQIAAVVPMRQTAVDAFAAATGASARVIEHKGHRIGYVHLWCCTHRQVLQQLEHAVRVKLADTDGLVLDLRDGYGGSPGWFDYVFFQPELTIRVRTRDGHTALERYGYGNRPLAAIINSGSRSAKEYLAYELKKTGRATLVGSTTAGYFLGAGAEAIGDDGLLMFPASDLLLDGQRLEGVGVAPHIAVDPVATYSPDDSQVRAAVDEVAKRLRT